MVRPVREVGKSSRLLAGKYMAYYKPDPREQRVWHGDLIRMLDPDDEVW